jgi:regulator of protease activity HflC (stomatin/prohibitin superfamily)
VTADDPVTADNTATGTAVARPPGQEIRERPAPTVAGWPMLGLAVIAMVAGVVLIATGAAHSHGLIPAGIVLILLALGIGRGLISVSPGEAQVVQLFGNYRGTIRSDGLHWLYPANSRRKVSTRVRNHQTGMAKVNDADGNPIEIAAVLVWRVEDTAKAVFGVDDLGSFVAIQAETGVRQIASQYPYDDYGEDRPSLRGATTEITADLVEQLTQRVAPAGVKIIEARFNRLSYAPEIAYAMLRRQQAGAMVAARQKIVEGAVGMVESALARLDADGLVELDTERKAAMVSNMLVVLCSDHPTQPVVNTGTLYQ